MANSIPLSWKIRKRFWSRWQALRFSLSKPQKIGLPKPNTKKIEVVPFKQSHVKIPMEKVLVFERLPREETKLGMRVLVAVGLFFNKLLPPMKAGLPEIDADICQTLDFGLTSSYRKSFRAPVLPQTYEGGGKPDLEDLAVQSPYSVFLERGADGLVQWDFRSLGDYEHQDGLRSLGLRVVFSESTDTKTLTATEVESNEYGAVHPRDTDWEASKKLAVCASTTHMSLTRHFNYVHLISGNHWDIATRNHLPTDHPLYRLVWPHIFNSLYTNYGITRVQLLPDGDFVNMFSFTHDGLMKYYDAMYERYDIAITDPEADWERRGLADSKFDCPSHENLRDLFTVMHDHATRYIHAYYESDEALQKDKAVAEWLEALDGLIPNGLNGTLDGGVTRDGLARAIGSYIYEGNTIHDMVGTTLWDYQLWADRNPTRIYRDGRRIPVDVFQRVVNNNFALQLRRAPMLADYGHISLDSKGAALFTQFYEDCRALQDRYDRTPVGPWRMEPKNLEISMNG